MEREERRKERENRKLERKEKRKEKKKNIIRKLEKKQYSDFLDFELRFVRFFVRSGNLSPYAAGIFQPPGSQVRAGLYKSFQKLENQFYFVSTRHFFQQSEPCPNIFEEEFT